MLRVPGFASNNTSHKSLFISELIILEVDNSSYSRTDARSFPIWDGKITLVRAQSFTELK